jgi:hypothetical protein
MTYEVNLTDEQTAKIETIFKCKTDQEIVDIFGSYVGNLVGKISKKGTVDPKVDKLFGGYIRYMLNVKPDLNRTPHFIKLAVALPKRFQPDIDEPISEPVPKPKPVKVQHSTSKVPGVATAITNPERDEDGTFTDMPHELQIAIKYQSLYNSATKRDLAFDLSLADVGKLLTRKTCYYTGARLKGSGVSRRTIDRLDADLGYVKGNVVACTHTANQLKNYLFESEFSEIRTTKKMLQNLLKKMPD